MDYCFGAVNPTDVTGKKMLSDIGYIFLDPPLGKLGSEEDEALNIIYHPDGDYMQLSIRENLFIKITPISVWYKTDTSPGSSGSPVFNDHWQAVALHQMSVGRKNEAGENVDIEGLVIPKVNGKIDVSKVVCDANEGIRISVILKDLFSTFTDKQILKGLKIKPVSKTDFTHTKSTAELTASSNNNSTNSAMESNNLTNSVNISFPASLIEKMEYLILLSIRTAFLM